MLTILMPLSCLKKSLVWNIFSRRTYIDSNILADPTHDGDRFMNKINFILLPAAIVVSLAAAGGPALAESAHNAQTAAHTSNAYDDAATAYMKQVRANHAPTPQYQPAYGTFVQ